MKWLVKKILEAGLVEKHAALLMEKWGQLEPGSADLVGQKKLTRETLFEFAEELESVLSLDAPRLKGEIRLEVHEVAGFTVKWYCLEKYIMATAYMDEMGRLIVKTQLMPPGAGFVRGDCLNTIIGKTFRVLDVEELKEDDKVTAYQLTVEDW